MVWLNDLFECNKCTYRWIPIEKDRRVTEDGDPRLECPDCGHWNQIGTKAR